MKRFLILLLCICFLTASATAANTADIRGYDKASGYQYVLLGSYPYEKDGTPAPLLWRILAVKEENQALLLTEDVIDVQQVIYCDNQADIKKRNFRRITAFNQSDLYTWLNTDMLDTMCSGQPFRDALIDTENGKLFPLTNLEFMNTEYGFPHTKDVAKIREAVGTPYAKHHILYSHFKGLNTLNIEAGNSPYWTSTLRRADTQGWYLQIVGFDGHLSWGNYTRVNIGIRPSVLLDLSQCSIAGGSGTETDPWRLSIGE